MKWVWSQRLGHEELIFARGAATSGKGSYGQLDQVVDRALFFGKGLDTILFRARVTKFFMPASCVFGRRREDVCNCTGVGDQSLRMLHAHNILNCRLNVLNRPKFAHPGNALQPGIFQRFNSTRAGILSGKELSS